MKEATQAIKVSAYIKSKDQFFDFGKLSSSKSGDLYKLKMFFSRLNHFKDEDIILCVDGQPTKINV